MKRCLVVVEGQTEATFVTDVIAPHFGTILSVEPRTLGGLNSYGKLRNLLRSTLLDRDASVVTTMVDYCDITTDFPGYGSLSSAASASARDRAKQIGEAIGRDLDDPRFLPYFSLHEFEALVFAALGSLQIEEIQAILTEDQADAQRLQELQTVARSVTTPEEIDGGRDTHPSRRLEQMIRRYRKTANGARLVAHAGLVALRESCPHFDSWVSRLEKIAQTA